jgi:hypothetical protein
MLLLKLCSGSVAAPEPSPWCPVYLPKKDASTRLINFGRERTMSDTAIVGENVEVIQTRGPQTAFTWSVVIAGALAAWAVAFIFVSLGTGIGLAVSTPYSGPSATTMTIGGAIWLVFAETVAFTTGGYLAARLRSATTSPDQRPNSVMLRTASWSGWWVSVSWLRLW